jgi:outer membrane protein assembly factor BamE
MRKIFSVVVLFSLAVAAAGCSREKRPEERRSSVLESLPFVYKMTVQQGNIVTPEMVDRLELGMTKHQVEMVMGTPLLTDFFHSNRWDYSYTIKRGHDRMEQRDLTLHFQEDQLMRVEGDLQPNPTRAAAAAPQEIAVSVPDHKERKGLLTKSLNVIGLKPKE